MFRTQPASRTIGVTVLALAVLLGLAHLNPGRPDNDKPAESGKDEKAPDDVRQQLKDLQKEVARLRGELEKKSPRPEAAGTTRVAILNLKYVITNYKQFKAFQEENKKVFLTYEDQYKPLAVKLQELRKALAITTGAEPERREAIEKEAKSLDEKIKEITEEARAKLGKRESEQLASIYKEIGAAVATFAKEKEIALVLHYSDGVNRAEMDSEANLVQKMSQRPLVPMYWGDEVDISQHILQVLNAQYAAKQPE